MIERELVDGMASLPIERAELARSEATAAPRDIATSAVVEHGLRHLAWLVQDDPVVACRAAGGVGPAARRLRPRAVPEPGLKEVTMTDDPQYTNRCACGWEISGSEDEVVDATIDHGRRIHNMEATREQVIEASTRAPEPPGGGPRRPADGVTRRAVTYASYLALEELLAAQRPLSRDADGRPEHDELLFIVIHQVYELWFKQLLHELTEVQRTLEAGDTDTTLHLLNRVLKILKTLVAQIDVLETMTPLQFTSFRDRLESASGFQSAQFREIEAILGRRDASAPAAHPEGSAGRARIEAAQRATVAVGLVPGVPRRARPRACGRRARARRHAAPGAGRRGSRTSSSASIAPTRTRPSSPNGSSTSTRASRSGATAM